jgi:hypothetical protein
VSSAEIHIYSGVRRRAVKSLRRDPESSLIIAAKSAVRIYFERIKAEGFPVKEEYEREASEIQRRGQDFMKGHPRYYLAADGAALDAFQESDHEAFVKKFDRLIYFIVRHAQEKGALTKEKEDEIISDLAVRIVDKITGPEPIMPRYRKPRSSAVPNIHEHLLLVQIAFSEPIRSTRSEINRDWLVLGG